MGKNNKNERLEEALRQFAKDLQNDKDFIEFKKNSRGYGTVIVHHKTFTINEISVTSQTIIAHFKKDKK